MTVTLCALLWARPGCEVLLSEYEDQVLALLDRHDGRLLSRVRSLESGPAEVQIIDFVSEQGLADYQNDPARLALSALRDRAVDRSQVIRVRHV